MLSSLLRSALVLAAVCCLTDMAVAENIVTTCGNKVQRLSCDEGVVKVLTVAYGRTDNVTCMEVTDSDQPPYTACSQEGALEALANRCNGTKVCEVNQTIFSATADPCPNTNKYIRTTYKCLPAHHVVACEFSTVELICDASQEIALIGAFYGRADRTTCIYGRPENQLKNITCFTPTANRVVAESCNRKSSCTFHANNTEFGDDCRGTFKYLELAYTCKCPL